MTWSLSNKLFLFLLSVLVILCALFYMLPFKFTENNWILSKEYIKRTLPILKRVSIEATQDAVKVPLKIVFQPDRSLFSTRLYITSWPNHGAGIGHQFGEWLQGVWAAFKYNITYVYTPFLINSAHWNSFLGFGTDEILEEDIKNHFGPPSIRQIGNDGQTQDSIERWILGQRNEYYNQSAIGNPVILRLYRVNSLISYTEAVCYPPVSNVLRMKYCMKRVHQPLQTDLYRNDRLADKFIVGMHLRCGDSCYDSYRTTSFSSVENTILKLNSDLSSRYKNRKIVFHLFSEPPKNNTAENHFRPLLHNPKFQTAILNPIVIVPHFSLTAPLTLHHLIMSDILFTAQSSFSHLAAILRVGIAFGAVSGCPDRLYFADYDKKTGYYSSEKLLKVLDQKDLLESKQQTTNTLEHKSVEECRIYQRSNNI